MTAGFRRRESLGAHLTCDNLTIASQKPQLSPTSRVEMVGDDFRVKKRAAYPFVVARAAF